MIDDPKAHFLKVPKLSGSISGDIINSLSSKRRHLKAQNFAVTLIFIPYTKYEDQLYKVLCLAFWKVYGTFKKRAPR